MMVARLLAFPPASCGQAIEVAGHRAANLARGAAVERGACGAASGECLLGRARPRPQQDSGERERFMTAERIAIIDYGMGNLRSVQKGFERVGHAALVTEDVATALAADKLVLPGVGAFQDAIEQLRQRGWVEPLRAALQAGKPLLGICLGLQLLFDRSYEDGCHEGLGILRGEVVRFELPRQYKVPHMGWNRARVVHCPPILEGIADDAYFYFVHSYFARPAEREVIALESDYGGPFTAMVWRERLYACQFHPEKSQADGLRLLKNFAEFG